jgi:hypothetical protein
VSGGSENCAIEHHQIPQGDLIWNPDLLFSESQERSRSHFVIRRKERGWTLLQRQKFFRGTPSNKLRL